MTLSKEAMDRFNDLPPDTKKKTLILARREIEKGEPENEAVPKAIDWATAEKSVMLEPELSRENFKPIRAFNKEKIIDNELDEPEY